MKKLQRQVLRTATKARDACLAALGRLAIERTKTDSPSALAEIESLEAGLRDSVAAVEPEINWLRRNLN